MDIKIRISAFFIGVLSALYCFPLPDKLYVLVLEMLLCLVLLASRIWFNGRFKNYILIQIILTLCCGNLWVSIHLYHHFNQQFSSSLENKNLHIQGEIATIPLYINKHYQFQFNVTKINNTSQNFKIQLAWYNEHPKLMVGQAWNLMVRLKRPHGFTNPGSFDFEAYQLDQRIVANGYIVKCNHNYLISPPRWYSIISVIRQKIAHQLLSLNIQGYIGIILALTLGIREFITPEQWQIFLNTGTNHLVVIAGLHIGMFAGLCYKLIDLIWRRFSVMCNYIAAQRISAGAAIIGAMIYATLAGFALPTQRALIMLSIFMLGVIFSRATSAWRSWWIALLLVLIVDPFAPVTVSFWLSFAAVGAILYGAVLKDSIKNKVLSWLSVQLAIFIGLIPFSLLWFMQFSLVSVLANAIAIPIVGLIIVPCALASIVIAQICLPLAQLILNVTTKILKILFTFLSVLSQNHSLQIGESISNGLILTLSILGIILLLAPRSWPARWPGVICLLPIFFTVNDKPADNEAWFELLDVGQGLASVIRTHNHTLVFDTGPKYSEEFDTGKAVVVPFLKSQHIRKLDALVISHRDNDHRGGLESVLAAINVKNVYVNEQNILPTSSLCEAGISWRWDGVDFEFLTADPNTLESVNDRSCVLKISNKWQSLLLTGDIETRAEKQLIDKYHNKLTATVIVAPHHGSKTSSSFNFIKTVNPHYVLFANGYLNRYHFPNAKIVQRYQSLNIQNYATAQCGMISWSLSNSDIIAVPNCYRLQHWQVWYN